MHRPHSVQVIDVDIMRQGRALNAEDASLANALRGDVRARSVVVVEEGVETDAVSVDGGTAQDTESPAVGAVDRGLGRAVPGRVG